MRVLVIVLGALLLAGGAPAQVMKYDAGVFGDPMGSQTQVSAPPFTPFSVYGMAYDLDGGVAGYEGSLQYDPSLILMGCTWTPPDLACSVCQCDPWAVGVPGCLETVPGEWFPFLSWEFLLLEAETDLPICLRAYEPSSFVPAAPGYARCDMSLQPFGVAENGQGIYPDGCLVVNPTWSSPIDLPASSWAAVKARY